VLECPPARFEICGVVVLVVVWGEDVVVGEIVIEEFLPQKRLKDLEKEEGGENDMHGQQREEKQRKQQQHMWSPSSQRCCCCSCSSSCSPGNNNTGGCSAFDKPCSKGCCCRPLRFLCACEGHHTLLSSRPVGFSPKAFFLLPVNR
jgi:hypothetical protein